MRALLSLLFLVPTVALAAEDSAADRRRMVEQINTMAAQTAFETTRPRFDSRVTEALEKVRRHRFVPADQVSHAYENRPLPIGFGQTISQPYIVALMTDLMNPQPGHKVLEIGTGSGYQAAVLAELVDRVYTIEIVEPLARQAAERLKALNYRNVEVKTGDGYYGWEQQGPFDAIMVTAAASHVPPPLVRQLKPGGRMVIPVGTPFLTQSLMLIQKAGDGSVSSRQILPVRFVPLTGGH